MSNALSCPIPAPIQVLIDRVDRQGDTALLPSPKTPTDRFDALVSSLFPGYRVLNLTDFQYGRAWQYLFALTDHPDAVAMDQARHNRAVHELGGHESVFVDLSAVAPYVLFRFVRYLPAGEMFQTRWSDAPMSPAQEMLLDRLMAALAAEGYQRIDRSITDIPVPDVTTDLCDLGEATVGSCLFYG